MRQRHSCVSHGSNVEHNALRSWHATMYKFVTSMVLFGLGMQQCAMHNAAIQKTTFFGLGVYSYSKKGSLVYAQIKGNCRFLKSKKVCTLNKIVLQWKTSMEE